jgi:hypothetical protein
MDHYGNIIMIPVKFIVDVDMSRTLHDKVDKTGFNTHLETIKYDNILFIANIRYNTNK